MLTLFAIAVVLLRPAAVHADASVSFADDQPLVVDLTSSPQAATVLVVNSSTRARPVAVTLSFSGPAAPYLYRTDMHPTPVPPGIKGITVNIRPQAVASTGTLILTASDGSVDREPVHLVGAPPPAHRLPRTLIPGTFDVLVVHATSFVPSFFRPLPSARRWALWGFPLLIAAIALFAAYVAARKKKGVVVVTLITVGVIGAVIASLVLLGGCAASFIDGRLGHAVPPETWVVIPPAPGRIDANLIGDNGQIGSMVVNGGTLTVKDLPSAGTYTGTVDTQPVSDAGIIKVMVIVRDWWLYAFAAVLLGVALGSLVSGFYLRRPAREFDADAADVSAEIAGHDSDWYAKSVGRAWGEPYLLAVEAEGWLAEIRGLATSDPAGANKKLNALRTLDATTMQELRDQVARLGKRRDELCAEFPPVVVTDSRGWLAPLTEDLNLIGVSLDDAPSEIRARAKLIPPAKAAADTAAHLAAQLRGQAQRIGALGDGDIKELLLQLWADLVKAVLAAGDKAALESLSAEFNDLERNISAAESAKKDVTARPYAGPSLLMEDFGEYLLPFGPPSLPTPVGDWQAPSPPASANRDTLVAVAVRAIGLTAGTDIHWQFSDDSRSATFPAPPPGLDGTTLLEIKHRFGSGPEQASATVISEDGQPVSTPWSGRVATFSVRQRGRSALGADDRIVALVAGVLAVGSGMAALYLKTPAWGSAGDYIAALLWGSVTSEGIKLIVNVVGKRWPIAG
jgi:hypothetical protein